tara:strand:- start:365 stop:535 length:171 start_codon:yes stop_codon:yes gene_type:complete
MKYKFECHVCGNIYQLEKRSIPKSKFIDKTKNSSPILICPVCGKADIVGRLVGSRK